MSRDSDAFEPLPEADTARLLAWLAARYGLGADAFAAHRFWRRVGQGSIWIAARDLAPPAGQRCEALGLLALRKMPPAGKLTSLFLQRFGGAATRNVARLSAADAAAFMAREPVAVDPRAQGYQVVVWGGRVLGAGFASAGRLRSEWPKSWARDQTKPSPVE